MSKFKGNQLLNSKVVEGKKKASNNNSYTDDLSSQIYKAEGLYFQYLRTIKSGNSNDAYDFSTAFMTF